MDYSRRSGESTRPRATLDSGRSSRGRLRPAGGSTTGYPLRRHNIRFNDRPSPRGFFARYDSRGLLMIAGLILVAFLLIFGAVGCVRSCNRNQEEKRRAEEVNPIDERVVVGASEEVTRVLIPALNEADNLDWLAQHADQYTDPTLIQLAIREPEALAFVKAYPTAEKEASPYDGTVEAGTAPFLYNWDERWGNVDYAGHPLAVTGSGPSVMSMAYMALTGATDKTPADMAALAAQKAYDKEAEYTTAQLFLMEAQGMGLLCNQIDVSGERITGAISGGNLIICQIKADTLTPDAHWVLVTRVNENGSVEVHDPTSAEVSNREWSAGTIASASSNIFAIAKA